jgi:hypothetical protein
MKNLSSNAKAYILSTILIGFGLFAAITFDVDWTHPGLYLLAALGAVAQTLKVEGPNAKTNYSIAWFVYGFAFLALGPAAAILVVVVSHLVEWFWHKYPWYIQSFNIAAHVVPLYLAGVVYVTLNRGNQTLSLLGAFGMAAANLLFVLGNHFLVGLVVKLARAQTFSESGVFEFLTLFLDFTILSMGAVTALIWQANPFASLLNILPLVLLYHAIRVPALLRQLKELKSTSARQPVASTGD